MSKTDLRAMLSDATLLQTRGYVNGAWVGGGHGTFAVTNPARGDVIADVADLDRADVAAAIDGAKAAQTAWAAKPAKERGAILRKWFTEMMAAQEDLAKILTAEMGKPLAEARGEIAYAANFIEFYAEEAKRVYGETIPSDAPNKRWTLIKQPVGVAASITPWNFPAAMITRKAAPGTGRRVQLCGAAVGTDAFVGPCLGGSGAAGGDTGGGVADRPVQ